MQSIELVKLNNISKMSLMNYKNLVCALSLFFLCFSFSLCSDGNHSILDVLNYTEVVFHTAESDFFNTSTDCTLLNYYLGVECAWWDYFNIVNVRTLWSTLFDYSTQIVSILGIVYFLFSLLSYLFYRFLSFFLLYAPLWLLRLIYGGASNCARRIIRVLPCCRQDFPSLTGNERAYIRKLMKAQSLETDIPLDKYLAEPVADHHGNMPSEETANKPRVASKPSISAGIALKTKFKEEAIRVRALRSSCITVAPPCPTALDPSCGDSCMGTIAAGEQTVVVPARYKSSDVPSRYLIDDPSLTSAAWIQEVTISTSTGASANSFAMNSLFGKSPRVLKLFTRFVQTRFDCKVSIVPRVAQGTIGTWIVSMEECPQTLRTATTNIDSVPFMSRSALINIGSPTTIVFDVPFPFNTTWIDGGYMADRGNALTFNPLILITNATGAPTTITFDIFLQLTRVYARIPMAQQVSAQGLFNMNTINISDLRDSTLPLNILGDEMSNTFPALGFDYPGDTRQVTTMRQTPFQKCANTRGVLDVTRMTFNARDMPAAPITFAVDEMDINYIMSIPFKCLDSVVSTTSASGVFITSFPIIPSIGETNRAWRNGTLQWYIMCSSYHFTADYIKIKIIKPAGPFMTGKLLVVYNPSNYAQGAAFTWPSNMKTTTTWDVSGFPGAIVDFSCPECEFELKFPFCPAMEMGISPMMLNQYYGALGYGVISNNLGSIAIYCLQAPSVNVNIPVNTYFKAYQSFEGYRPYNPICCPYNTLSPQGAELMLNVKSLPPDLDNDDAISIKQYCMQPWPFATYEILANGASIPFYCTTAINAIPPLRWYNRFIGSLRFRFTWQPIICPDANSNLLKPSLRINIWPQGNDLPSAQVQSNDLAIRGNYWDYSNVNPVAPPVQTSNMTARYTTARCYSAMAPVANITLTPESPEQIVEVPMVNVANWIDTLNDPTIVMQFMPTSIFNWNNSNEIGNLIIDVMVGDNFRAFGLSNDFSGKAGSKSYNVDLNGVNQTGVMPCDPTDPSA